MKGVNYYESIQKALTDCTFKKYAICDKVKVLRHFDLSLETELERLLYLTTQVSVYKNI